ncbi:MAG: DUF4271 domain-containing protein [Bacteroidota bacterium]|nr:DUF4271 domain-containing protein [Bacteroidota bacterium]
MELIERNLIEFFGLLIPFLIAIIMCVYVTRTRINLVRSIFLAPFNKGYFKNVDNNTAEQEFTILLWSSVFIQGIMLHFYFSSTPSILIYITIATLILIKYVILNFSAVFLEQADLFRLYKTTFYLGVIHNGLVCIPTILFNILYLYRLESNTIQFVNGIFFLLLVTLFIYRFIFLFRTGLKENISYIHIILYLCTLEILPLGIISSYLAIS